MLSTTQPLPFPTPDSSNYEKYLLQKIIKFLDPAELNAIEHYLEIENIGDYVSLFHTHLHTYIFVGLF